jgi:hypothetical protein
MSVYLRYEPNLYMCTHLRRKILPFERQEDVEFIFGSMIISLSTIGLSVYPHTLGIEQIDNIVRAREVFTRNVTLIPSTVPKLHLMA